jgi:hypothetical protein
VAFRDETPKAPLCRRPHRGRGRRGLRSLAISAGGSSVTVMPACSSAASALSAQGATRGLRYDPDMGLPVNGCRPYDDFDCPSRRRLASSA